MLKHAWLAGRIVLTVGIFAYVLRDVDLVAAQSALTRFSLTTIEEVLLLIALDRLLMFWRWSALIRGASTVPPVNLARIFFVSSFIGSFLPAGVGGDALRAIQVGRQTQSVQTAVASVLIDRLLGLVAVGLSGCVGLLVSPVILPAGVRQLTFVATGVVVAATVAAFYADRLASRLLPVRIAASGFGGALVRLAAALASYRNRKHLVWQVAMLSIVVQAVRISLAWQIGVGLGLSVPFSYYWVFMPLNILIILLPLSLGGFGLPQGTMVWTLGPLGVPATEAFLLSLVFVLAGVVGNIPGAVLYSFGGSSAPSPRAPKAD